MYLKDLPVGTFPVLVVLKETQHSFIGRMESLELISFDCNTDEEIVGLIITIHKSSTTCTFQIGTRHLKTEPR